MALLFYNVMEMSQHLLFVDDDRKLRSFLSAQLSQRGYEVTQACNETEMRRVLGSAKVSLIVLDIVLPDKDGLAICRELRSSSAIPVIILTARSEPTDRVVGLEMGADDYLSKPVDLHELEARIRAVLRRCAGNRADSAEDDRATLGFEGWTLDKRQRRLRSPEGILVGLSRSEFNLLTALAERSQRVLSRDQLLEITRGIEAECFDRSIDMLISRIRRKLKADADGPELIRTVRGDGYMFALPVQKG